ncbi:MAG: radical SAM protein [Armatimonadota bacterium]|nr:MAG: radical SAM protein [Armatimonadota bacterium]
MKRPSENSARANTARALVIAAADDESAARGLARLRREMPGLHVTTVTRPGAAVPTDETIAAPAKGPYGFALSLSLLRQVRRGFDLACAIVSDLDSSAFRRAALLLRIARTEEKFALGPTGEKASLRDWLDRAHISLSPAALARAALASASAPYRRLRARRLLEGPRPPCGFKRVNIGVSDRCNQRCIMCSEHSPYCADAGRRMAADDILDERDFGLMDPETYRALIRDLSEMGCEGVELCGLGEPLLHPRLFEFLRQAKEAGLWVRLVTNAGLLDKENAWELVALGLDELHVSINAATPETYAKVHGVAESVFERVLAGIRAVAAARQAAKSPTPAIETSFVVQAGNYREPVEWVRTVVDAGADIVTFSALGAAPPDAPVQLSTEQLEEAKRSVAAAAHWARERGLEVRGTFGALADKGTSFSADLYAHMPCYIGHIFALITASGRIHPCCACERVVGDVAEGGFAAAWRAATYRQFREECLDLPSRWQQGSSLPALDGCSCMSCPYGPWNAEFHQRLHGQ